MEGKERNINEIIEIGDKLAIFINDRQGIVRRDCIFRGVDLKTQLFFFVNVQTGFLNAVPLSIIVRIETQDCEECNNNG